MANDSSLMLTTIDNPWSPFTHYDEWLAFDTAHGYNTPGLLARIANVSEDLPEFETESSINQAIEDIVRLNPSGIYRKVSDETPSIPEQVTGGGVLAK